MRKHHLALGAPTVDVLSYVRLSHHASLSTGTSVSVDSSINRMYERMYERPTPSQIFRC
jgi:hypothetical protein